MRVSGVVIVVQTIPTCIYLVKRLLKSATSSDADDKSSKESLSMPSGELLRWCKGSDWVREGIVAGNERSIVIVRSTGALMACVPKIQSRRWIELIDGGRTGTFSLMETRKTHHH